MKKQEKLQLLRKFKEKPLIDNVIIPLLEKMGFKNITVTHGSLEKGKDLLFYKENEFEERLRNHQRYLCHRPKRGVKP